MNTLLISYDLGVPETSEDYRKIIDYIKSHGSWANPLYSVWFIKTVEEASTIRDTLQKMVDRNDKVLVMNVTSDGWAFYNLDTKVADWMKQNI